MKFMLMAGPSEYFISGVTWILPSGLFLLQMLKSKKPNQTFSGRHFAFRQYIFSIYHRFRDLSPMNSWLTQAPASQNLGSTAASTEILCENWITCTSELQAVCSHQDCLFHVRPRGIYSRTSTSSVHTSSANLLTRRTASCFALRYLFASYLASQVQWSKED